MHKLTENTEELQILNERSVSVAFELKAIFKLSIFYVLNSNPDSYLHQPQS